MGEKIKKTGRIFLVTISVIFCLLFYVWQHIQTICLGYKLNELEKELSGLEEKNMRLKRDVSRNTNYQKLEKVACDKLKMVYPDNKNIIYVN
jgi:cell division protein FtsL